MIFTYIGGLITQIQSVIELNNLVFNKNKMTKKGGLSVILLTEYHAKLFIFVAQYKILEKIGSNEKFYLTSCKYCDIIQ